MISSLGIDIVSEKSVIGGSTLPMHLGDDCLVSELSTINHLRNGKTIENNIIYYTQFTNLHGNMRTETALFKIFFEISENI